MEVESSLVVMEEVGVSLKEAGLVESRMEFDIHYLVNLGSTNLGEVANNHCSD